MDIRKKLSAEHITPKPAEQRERLISQPARRTSESAQLGADRSSSAQESRKLRDTIAISVPRKTAGQAAQVGGSASVGSASRREHVESLAQRYAAGEDIVTPELLSRTAENILRGDE